MNNSLLKMVLIPSVVELIADEFKITLKEARDMFYKSRTMKLLEDDLTGLYGDSALYILSVFEEEYKNK